MSTETPSEAITALLAYSQADEEGIIVTVSRQAIHEVVGENARLREEIEMLETRHAAAMLHAQTHADEYNALREELAEAKRVDDITMTAFATLEEKFKEQVQRAEQAEARVLTAENKVAWQEVEIADLRDDVKRLMQTVSECEERALAAEKAHQRSHAEVMRLAEELRKYQPGSPMILNATTGAKHD